MLIDNSTLLGTLNEKLNVLHTIKDSSVFEFFAKDFYRRFSWNSNSLEGNTLSLEETIDLIDYDETYGNHKYTEYTDAKNMYKASITKIDFNGNVNVTEEWVIDANNLIRGKICGYRGNNVFIGTHFDVVYVPPSWDTILNKMNTLLNMYIAHTDIKSLIKSIAEFHIQFERIHPFHDGNGRTGRLAMNQQLINNGLLPIIFNSRSNYQRSFKVYNKSKDYSLLEHEIIRAEINAIDMILELQNQVISMNTF